MTHTNNFDQSSTGTDISFIGFFDTDESRRLFDENFKSVQSQSRQKTSVLYYTGTGNLPGPDEVRLSLKGEKAAKVKILADDTGFDAKEIEKWDEETLDGAIKVMYAGDICLLNFVTENLPALPDLEIVANKKLSTLTTRGYSKGDYALVIYCPEDFEKAWGKMPDQKDIQKMVDHLFWDAPVYALLYVNGKEHSIWDMPDREDYVWDKADFIRWASTKTGVTQEALSPLIPKDLEYV